MTVLGLILFIFGAIGIVAIAWSKMSVVALIDIETIKEAHEARLKRNLLWARIVGRVARVGHAAYGAVRPWSITAVESIHNAIDHLKKLEAAYVAEHVPKKSVTKSEARALAEQKVEEGKKLVLDEKIPQAEEQFIEAIKLDKKCVHAYEELADLYVRMKEWEKAEGLYQFLLKLHTHEGRAHAGLGRIATSRGKLRAAEGEYLRALARHKMRDNYIDLAGVYLQMGEPGKAIPQYEAALEFEPLNPKFLDLLLEASILSGRRVLSWKVYDRLARANPENAKLPEIAKRIREM